MQSELLMPLTVFEWKGCIRRERLECHQLEDCRGTIPRYTRRCIQGVEGFHLKCTSTIKQNWTSARALKVEEVDPDGQMECELLHGCSH
jgi:hypothetical protein